MSFDLFPIFYTPNKGLDANRLSSGLCTCVIVSWWVYEVGHLVLPQHRPSPCHIAMIRSDVHDRCMGELVPWVRLRKAVFAMKGDMSTISPIKRNIARTVLHDRVL